MLIIISASYRTVKPETWTPEQYAVFRANWPISGKELPEKQEDWLAKDHKYFHPSDQRVTMEEAAALQDAGFEFDIKGVDGTMITRMKDRPIPGVHDDVLHRLQSGASVQISIPDIGLMLIDEVKVRGDCCTDVLQDDLDDGWRILAVCPPNAARRPDYVLGRKKRT